MAKIICVLYDDPVDGYPKTYARDTIPGHQILSRWPNDTDAFGDRFQTR